MGRNATLSITSKAIECSNTEDEKWKCLRHTNSQSSFPSLSTPQSSYESYKKKQLLLSHDVQQNHQCETTELFLGIAICVHGAGAAISRVLPSQGREGMKFLRLWNSVHGCWWMVDAGGGGGLLCVCGDGTTKKDGLSTPANDDGSTTKPCM